MKRCGVAVQKRLQTLLHEIGVSQVAREGPVAREAFGEADFLLNMSSRVNAGEELLPEQVAKIEEIWERETRRKITRGGMC